MIVVGSFPEFSNPLINVVVFASVRSGTVAIRFDTTLSHSSFCTIVPTYFSIAFFTHSGALFFRAFATVTIDSVG